MRTEVQIDITKLLGVCLKNSVANVARNVHNYGATDLHHNRRIYFPFSLYPNALSSLTFFIHHML
jgi:hypothetical protein